MRPVSKHILQTAILALLLTLGSLGSASAQDYIPVHVKVYNTAEKDANGKSALYDQVVLFLFETEAEGRKAVAQLTDLINNQLLTEGVFDFYPKDCSRIIDLGGSGGEKRIDDVSPEGSMLFLSYDLSHSHQLVTVQGRSEIEVFLSAAQTIEAAGVYTELRTYTYVTPPVVLEEVLPDRIWRPFQFLEYPAEPAQLDPEEPYFRKQPHLERRSGDMQLSLQFAPGQSYINDSDTAGTRMLDSLRSTMYDITHNGRSVLRQFSIQCAASPEGKYASNLSLARERLEYITGEIIAQIPDEKKANLRSPLCDARVASWDELAEILAEEGFTEEAKQICGITSAYPDNIDAQNPRIYKLPFYNTIIKDHLPELRTVKVEWVYETYKAPSKEEVLEKFYNNPNYAKDGTVEFTDYEVWVLLQALPDSEEREHICRRSINKEIQKREEIRWTLPANILASSLLKRDIVDTTVLAPFIFENYRSHQPLSISNFTYILNPAPVVANQVNMMLRGGYNDRAGMLAQKLKNQPEYRLLYAVSAYKAGYFHREESEETMKLVHDSSPLNAVVMDMAMYHLDEAQAEMNMLNQDEAVTHYLKAQLACMKHFNKDKKKATPLKIWDKASQNEAIESLLICFRLDDSFIEKARLDGYIFEDLFDRAEKAYYAEKQER